MAIVHFLRPYWFVAIIPLLLACWRLRKINGVDNWYSICDEHLLTRLLVLPRNSLTLPIVLLGIGGLIAILALAGPSFKQERQPIYRAMSGRILLLNLSPSMLDLIGSTRKIDFAHFKLLDYLNRQKEGLTGLVVYTDEAHIITPLTEDNHTIAHFIPLLDPSIMPTSADDTSIGLNVAEKLLRQGGLSSGDIMLITDKVTNYSKTKQLATALYKAGFRLYVFAISNDVDFAMQEIAMAGGGKVIKLTPSNQDIDELLAAIQLNSLTSAMKKSHEQGFLWQDNGRVIVLFLLPFALFAFRKRV
jgi:Ca-activated chloride channel homolog